MECKILSCKVGVGVGGYMQQCGLLIQRERNVNSFRKYKVTDLNNRRSFPIYSSLALVRTYVPRIFLFFQRNNTRQIKYNSKLLMRTAQSIHMKKGLIFHAYPTDAYTISRLYFTHPTSRSPKKQQTFSFSPLEETRQMQVTSQIYTRQEKSKEIGMERHSMQHFLLFGPSRVHILLCCRDIAFFPGS